MPIEERITKEWTQVVTIDIHDLFFGARIGSGLSREVFDYMLDTTLVAKIEASAEGQNAYEYFTWCAVEDTKWEKWFAGVRYCSPSFSCILQDKTTVPTEEDWKKFPKSIPSFLMDARRENWGMLNGNFVVHDYGFSHLMKDGLKSAKLVRRDSKLGKRSRVNES